MPLTVNLSQTVIFLARTGVALVYHARHRFLEDQQFGETGPTG